MNQSINQSTNERYDMKSNTIAAFGLERRKFLDN